MVGDKLTRSGDAVFFIIEKTLSLALEEAGVGYTLIATFQNLGYVLSGCSRIGIWQTDSIKISLSLNQTGTDQ